MAKRPIAEPVAKQGIEPSQRTIQADRGRSMTSKSVAFLLCYLGVTKSDLRPQVSNDNPHSESQFKTLKYRPAFVRRFGSILGSRALCATFFEPGGMGGELEHRSDV